MKIELYDERMVSEHFICAMAYGDTTGIDDSDEKMLDVWFSELPDNYILDFTDVRDEFTMCDVTGLMSSCCQVNIYKRID